MAENDQSNPEPSSDKSADKDRRKSDIEKHVADPLRKVSVEIKSLSDQIAANQRADDKYRAGQTALRWEQAGITVGAILSAATLLVLVANLCVYSRQADIMGGQKTIMADTLPLMKAQASAARSAADAAAISALAAKSQAQSNKTLTDLTKIANELTILANAPNLLLTLRLRESQLILHWDNLGRSSAENVEVFYTVNMTSGPTIDCTYSPPKSLRTLEEEKQHHAFIIESLTKAYQRQGMSSAEIQQKLLQEERSMKAFENDIAMIEAHHGATVWYPDIPEGIGFDIALPGITGSAAAQIETVVCGHYRYNFGDSKPPMKTYDRPFCLYYDPLNKLSQSCLQPQPEIAAGQKQ